MDKPRKFLSKIKSLSALSSTLKRVRSNKKKPKIVFTNGCFDLLHKGHVTYLEAARKRGDILVVALNADESVKRLKGPERPLNTLADRMEVIGALECVDFVTWFEEETPLNAINKLKPDVLVKGGDWKPEQIVGSTEVRSWKGKVFSLPYVEGKSTTELIALARKTQAT